MRYNNVDVLYSFPLGNKAVDLFVASDRYKDVLAVYAINPANLHIRDVTDPAGPLIYTEPGEEPAGETTAYGLATYYDASTDAFYAFVSHRETSEVAQLQPTSRGGAVGWEVVRRLTLTLPDAYDGDNPQVEGMVVDAELGFAYFAQEQVGIWKLALAGGEPELVHPLDGEVLTADAEGLTVYYGPDGSGYLLASSQGSSTFAVYDRAGVNRCLGSFRIGQSGDIDPADESDGAMVVNIPLGERFPEGLLVVHDGLNAPEVLVEDDGELENASTSFKFIPWQRVAAAFDPPLMVSTRISPR